MIDKMLSVIAPYLCFGCQKIGTILCDSCSNNIVSKPWESCIQCKNLAKNGICKNCLSTFAVEKAWLVGRREGILEELINSYKFARTKATHQVLAELLHKRLPELSPETIIVPIPTVTSHIRARGYDHCALIAKALANKRSLVYSPLLQRRTKTTQRGASKIVRHIQVEQAFTVNGRCDGNTRYLLIDDVMTTGATLKAAAKVLQTAGAVEILMAAVAWQPLDD